MPVQPANEHRPARQVPFELSSIHVFERQLRKCLQRHHVPRGGMKNSTRIPVQGPSHNAAELNRTDGCNSTDPRVLLRIQSTRDALYARRALRIAAEVKSGVPRGILHNHVQISRNQHSRIQLQRDTDTVETSSALCLFEHRLGQTSPTKDDGMDLRLGDATLATFTSADTACWAALAAMAPSAVVVAIAHKNRRRILARCGVALDTALYSHAAANVARIALVMSINVQRSEASKNRATQIEAERIANETNSASITAKAKALAVQQAAHAAFTAARDSNAAEAYAAFLVADLYRVAARRAVVRTYVAQIASDIIAAAVAMTFVPASAVHVAPALRAAIGATCCNNDHDCSRCVVCACRGCEELVCGDASLAVAIETLAPIKCLPSTIANLETHAGIPRGLASARHAAIIAFAPWITACTPTALVDMMSIAMPAVTSHSDTARFVQDVTTKLWGTAIAPHVQSARHVGVSTTSRSTQAPIPMIGILAMVKLTNSAQMLNTSAKTRSATSSVTTSTVKAVENVKLGPTPSCVSMPWWASFGRGEMHAQQEAASLLLTSCTSTGHALFAPHALLLLTIGGRSRGNSTTTAEQEDTINHPPFSRITLRSILSEASATRNVSCDTVADVTMTVTPGIPLTPISLHASNDIHKNRVTTEVVASSTGPECAQERLVLIALCPPPLPGAIAVAAAAATSLGLSVLNPRARIVIARAAAAAAVAHGHHCESEPVQSSLQYSCLQLARTTHAGVASSHSWGIGCALIGYPRDAHEATAFNVSIGTRGRRLDGLIVLDPAAQPDDASGMAALLRDELGWGRSCACATSGCNHAYFHVDTPSPMLPWANQLLHEYAPLLGHANRISVIREAVRTECNADSSSGDSFNNAMGDVIIAISAWEYGITTMRRAQETISVGIHIDVETRVRQTYCVNPWHSSSILSHRPTAIFSVALPLPSSILLTQHSATIPSRILSSVALAILAAIDCGTAEVRHHHGLQPSHDALVVMHRGGVEATQQHVPAKSAQGEWTMRTPPDHCTSYPAEADAMTILGLPQPCINVSTATESTAFVSSNHFAVAELHEGRATHAARLHLQIVWEAAVRHWRNEMWRATIDIARSEVGTSEGAGIAKLVVMPTMTADAGTPQAVSPLTVHGLHPVTPSASGSARFELHTGRAPDTLSGDNVLLTIAQQNVVSAYAIVLRATVQRMGAAVSVMQGIYNAAADVGEIRVAAATELLQVSNLLMKSGTKATAFAGRGRITPIKATGATPTVYIDADALFRSFTAFDAAVEIAVSVPITYGGITTCLHDSNDTKRADGHPPQCGGGVGSVGVLDAASTGHLMHGASHAAISKPLLRGTNTPVSTLNIDTRGSAGTPHVLGQLTHEATPTPCVNGELAAARTTIFDSTAAALVSNRSDHSIASVVEAILLPHLRAANAVAIAADALSDAITLHAALIESHGTTPSDLSGAPVTGGCAATTTGQVPQVDGLRSFLAQRQLGSAVHTAAVMLRICVGAISAQAVAAALQHDSAQYRNA